MNREKAIRWVSYLVVAASFVFIGITISRIDISPIRDKLSLRWIPSILGAAVFYSAGGIVLGINWCVGLGLIMGKKLTPFAKILLIYLKTGIAKYLPSNMVHFASRHYLASRFDIPHRVLLLGNMLEIAFLSFSAAVIVAIGAAVELIAVPQSVYRMITPGRLVFAAVALAVAAAVAVRLFGPAKIRDVASELLRVRTFMVSPLLFLGYGVYFAITAMVLAFVFGTLLGVAGIASDLSFIFVGYTLAWVTGYLVPGAPGGLGVREVVLLLVFSPTYGESIVMAAAVTLRVITVLGDIVTFVWGATGYAIVSKSKK